jgi:hypothetical protein
LLDKNVIKHYTATFFMERLRLLFSLVALVFGLGIVGISLSAVSPVLSSGGEFKESQRELYWNGAILPDHLAYPVVMLVDKVRLESASPSERVELQIEYSQRRLVYAEALLEDDKVELAHSTLTKSQKYLLQAANEAIANDVSVESREKLKHLLAERNTTLRELNMKFADSDRVAIDVLVAESESAIDHLQKSLANSPTDGQS